MWRYAVAPVLLVAFLAGMAWPLTRTPQFYRDRMTVAAKEEQVQRSRQFLKMGSQLLNVLNNGNEHWKTTFDENSINGWLAEDFAANYQRLLPRSVQDPRVALEGDRLRLGFRWGVGPLQTVVQVAVSVWTPKNNILCIELHEASIGALPLPTTHVRRVLERIADATKSQLTWKRHGRRLVGILRLPTSRNIVLRRAEIHEGSLTLAGKGSRGIRLSSLKGPLVK